MQKKKGISLIVLVITIIVMIILAAAIILSLNNAGIIGNANKAVDESNMDTIKTAADLAYSEYLVNKSVIGASTLKDWLNQKVDYEGYKIHVVDGETVVVKEGSLADKFYEGEIKIGDYVNYKATETTKTVDVNVIRKISNEQPSVDAIVEMEVSSDMKWKVLGVDRRTNELLITSADIIDNVKDKETSEVKNITITGLYGWLHSEKILDDACAEFGKGVYATKGRSINLEDIEKITKYDKNKFVSRDGIKYRQTVHYDGKEYDGNTFSILYHPVKDEEGNYKFDENRVPIMEKIEKIMVNELYFYKLNEVLDEDSIEYKLLSLDDEGNKFIAYYLNEKIIDAVELDSIIYSYFVIGESNGTMMVGHSPIFRCREEDYAAAKGEGIGIRPVVHLNANTTATFENNEWVLK